MKPEDFILVSVDDHVVEPPDVWKASFWNAST